MLSKGVRAAGSSEYGTHKTFKAIFWPWLTGKILYSISSGSLFPRQRLSYWGCGLNPCWSIIGEYCCSHAGVMVQICQLWSGKRRAPLGKPRPLSLSLALSRARALSQKNTLPLSAWFATQLSRSQARYTKGLEVEVHRGTSLTRNQPPLGPYSSTMPRAL